MTKKEIRANLDKLFLSYLDLAIDDYKNGYGFSADNIIDTLQGVNLSAWKLGIITWKDWNIIMCALQDFKGRARIGG